jgi:predicted transcriptional regulator
MPKNRRVAESPVKHESHQLRFVCRCVSRDVKPMARTVKRMVQAGVVSTPCDRTVGTLIVW